MGFDFSAFRHNLTTLTRLVALRGVLCGLTLVLTERAHARYKAD